MDAGSPGRRFLKRRVSWLEGEERLRLWDAGWGGLRHEGCEPEERQGRNGTLLRGCRTEDRDRTSPLLRGVPGADFWNLPQCPGPSLPKDSPRPHPMPAQGAASTAPKPYVPISHFLLPANSRLSSFRLSRGSHRRTLSGCGARVQNHVFTFIRNVLGIKTIMRYTLSSITITKHPGTELRVIGRRGRRVGHVADGRG